MKSLSLLLFSALLSSTAFAQKPFSEHEYFSQAIGKWKSKGDLVAADGNTVPVSEELESKITEDGTFVIEGSRNMNGQEQDFRWVFSFNESTDLFECDYHHTGMENPVRMEVSVVGKKIEMRAPLGNSGNELVVSHELTDADTVDGYVLLQSVDGQSLLEGKIVYKREAE